MTDPDQLLPMLFTGVDEAYQRLWRRLDGLTEDEYLWPPVRGAWTLQGDGPIRTVDLVDPEPDPAPVTTIAWRMWHIGADCMVGYVVPHLGDSPLAVHGREWPADVAEGLATLQASFELFRARMMALGEDGIRRPLGPDWGPYAESSWADLVVHALDEIAHHGAEIALLRDLYRAGVRTTG